MFYYLFCNDYCDLISIMRLLLCFLCWIVKYFGDLPSAEQEGILLCPNLRVRDVIFTRYLNVPISHRGGRIFIYFYSHNISNTMTYETFVVKTGENRNSDSTQNNHTPDRWFVMLSFFTTINLFNLYIFVNRIIFDPTLLCLQQGNVLKIPIVR